MVYTRSEKKFKNEYLIFRNDFLRRIEEMSSVRICDNDTTDTQINLVIELYDYLSDYIEKNKSILYKTVLLIKFFVVAFKKKIQGLKHQIGSGNLEYGSKFLNDKVKMRKFYKTMERCENNIIDVFKNNKNTEEYLTEREMYMVNKKRFSRRDFDEFELYD